MISVWSSVQVQRKWNLCPVPPIPQGTTVSMARMQFWNVHRGNSSKGLAKPVTDTSHHLLEAGVEAGSALRNRVTSLVYSPVGAELGKAEPLPTLGSFLRHDSEMNLEI